MASKREKAEELAERGSQKIQEGRELKKQARIIKARAPKSDFGGAREGAGREPVAERRMQETFQLLPSTIEALASWAQEKTAELGKKISPRVFLELATRRALGLPIDAEEAKLLPPSGAA